MPVWACEYYFFKTFCTHTFISSEVATLNQASGSMQERGTRTHTRTHNTRTHRQHTRTPTYNYTHKRRGKLY